MIPACPPTTGQLTSCGSRPLSSEINLFARTISKVVTPKILFGLYLNKVSEGIISNRYRYYKIIKNNFGGKYCCFYKRCTYFPAFLNISLAMGTVELTGLEMIAKQASGQTSAAA